MSIGTIILIIVGAVVLLGILGVAAFVFVAKKAMKTQEKIIDKFKDWGQN